MDIKRLNDTQIREATDFLRFYKFIYVCNECGSVYGTDFREDKMKLCHKCELKSQEKRGKK